MDRASLFFKYSLIAVNALFFSMGCVLTAYGTYANNNTASIISGATLPSAVIAIGVFVMLISVFGILVLFLEWQSGLVIYFVVLLLLCIITFAVGIAVVVYRSSASSAIVTGWNDSPQTVQCTLQEAFTCCGLNAQYSMVETCHNCTTLNPPQPYCLDTLDNSLSHYYAAAGGCCIAFSLLMIVGQIWVCLLLRGIKQKRYLENVRAMHRKIREAKEDVGVKVRVGNSSALAWRRKKREMEAEGEGETDQHEKDMLQLDEDYNQAVTTKSIDVAEENKSKFPQQASRRAVDDNDDDEVLDDDDLENDNDEDDEEEHEVEMTNPSSASRYTAQTKPSQSPPPPPPTTSSRSNTTSSAGRATTSRYPVPSRGKYGQTKQYDEDDDDDDDDRDGTDFS